MDSRERKKTKKERQQQDQRDADSITDKREKSKKRKPEKFTKLLEEKQGVILASGGAGKREKRNASPASSKSSPQRDIVKAKPRPKEKRNAK